jgi:hypothetical protein
MAQFPRVGTLGGLSCVMLSCHAPLEYIGEYGASLNGIVRPVDIHRASPPPSRSALRLPPHALSLRHCSRDSLKDMAVVGHGVVPSHDDTCVPYTQQHTDGKPSPSVRAAEIALSLPYASRAMAVSSCVARPSAAAPHSSLRSHNIGKLSGKSLFLRLCIFGGIHRLEIRLPFPLGKDTLLPTLCCWRGSHPSASRKPGY